MTIRIIRRSHVGLHPNGPNQRTTGVTASTTSSTRPTATTSTVSGTSPGSPPSTTPLSTPSSEDEDTDTTETDREEVQEATSEAKRLSVLGGSFAKHAVKFILDTILTNELQQKFNWEGKVCWRTKDNFIKKGFKSTNMCQLMTDVLLRKPQFSTSQEEIGQITMKYLRNAPDRCGRRSKRKNVAGNQNEEN